MHLSTLLRSTNWKYAVGELLLIVAGVTLALMANSWYESSRERRDERLSLEQISSALEADLAFLREQFETLKRNEQQLLALLELLRQDELDPEARPYFGAVAAWRGVRMRSGPYDELKARGLALISSGSLRLNLVNLYESSFGSLEGVTANDEIFSRDQVLPYIYANFRRDGSGGWSPVNDYETLDADVYFENLVAAKLERLQVRLLPAYEQLVADIRLVLNEMRSELGESRS